MAIIIMSEISKKPNNNLGNKHDSSLLQLMWLASPSLPIGGFAYSDGLESAVNSGMVTNFTQTKKWLTDQLHLTLARADLPLLAHAITAWRNQDFKIIEELNHWFLMTRESSEARAQTIQMGYSFVEWLKNQEDALTDYVWLNSIKPTYPIAFALAISKTNASLQDCLTSFAFAWSENMVQAAMKAIPLGQLSGQKVLQQLCQEIPLVVASALNIPYGKWISFTPMLAILFSQHENQYSRLFRS